MALSACGRPTLTLARPTCRRLPVSLFWRRLLTSRRCSSSTLAPAPTSAPISRRVALRMTLDTPSATSPLRAAPSVLHVQTAGGHAVSLAEHFDCEVFVRDEDDTLFLIQMVTNNVPALHFESRIIRLFDRLPPSQRRRER
jgi:hypothetical protein